MLKLTKLQPIYRVRLALGTTNGDYMKKAKVQISADGKEWHDLEICGTTDTLFGVDHAQMEAYSYEATRCDFDGKGREAQYVRFILKELNDGKWLVRKLPDKRRPFPSLSHNRPPHEQRPAHEK